MLIAYILLQYYSYNIAYLCQKSWNGTHISWYIFLNFFHCLLMKVFASKKYGNYSFIEQLFRCNMNIHNHSLFSNIWMDLIHVGIRDNFLFSVFIALILQSILIAKEIISWSSCLFPSCILLILFLLLFIKYENNNFNK